MFTAAEQSELNELQGAPFEAFKELIVAFKTPTVTYFSNNGNFNFAYQEAQPGVSANYTPISGQFYATIEYVDDLNEEATKFPAKEKGALAVQDNFVIVRVSGDGKLFLDNAEKVMIDGEPFVNTTYSRPRGILSRTFFDYYYRRAS